MSRPRDTDPDDVDATFAAIVADLRAEGFSVDTHEVSAPKEDSSDEAPGDSAPAKQSGWRTGGADWEDTVLGGDPADASDDEHYVPPEPPPLPRPRKGAFIVLLFFVVGILLLVSPTLIGITATLATPLGIVSLAIGLALLLLRVKQGPPDGADPTNGAQV